MQRMAGVVTRRAEHATRRHPPSLISSVLLTGRTPLDFREGDQKPDLQRRLARRARRPPSDLPVRVAGRCRDLVAGPPRRAQAVEVGLEFGCEVH